MKGLVRQRKGSGLASSSLAGFVSYARAEDRNTGLWRPGVVRRHGADAAGRVHPAMVVSLICSAHPI
jgi:hypothetical protein